MQNQIIGSRIETRRKELGLTLDDIAQEIGVARSTVQRYEKGTIEKIKLPVIEAIARILSVDPAWLCGKTDKMNAGKPLQKNGGAEIQSNAQGSLSYSRPKLLDNMKNLSKVDQENVLATLRRLKDSGEDGAVDIVKTEKGIFFLFYFRDGPQDTPE